MSHLPPSASFRRRLRPLALVWATCCLAGAAVAADVVAPPPPPLPGHVPTTAPATGSKTVTNLWVDTDLRQVVQDISAQTDTVILCDQTVQGVLSLSVKDMPLADCLERMCAAGNYNYVLVKDYYVIGKADPGNAMFARLAEPQRVKLSYVLPDQARSLLHASLIPYCTFDKTGGTVVVTAPEPVRARILEAIKQIDLPVQQVAIDAVVFELTEDGSKDLGLDWQFKAGNWSGGSQNLVNTITYGVGSDFGTYVNLTLKAILQNKRGQVLANPRVLVVNNTEAEIFVGTEKYFTLLSGQASNPYYTLQSIKAGVTLKVLPYIGENGQITLALEPEVSDVTAEATQIAGASPQDQTSSSALPVVTRRHAKTVINTKDGQTVIIGGLLREQNRSTIQKNPVMGDIPGLGAAFRKVSTEKQQQEVVILITAHIVDARRAGADRLASRLEQRYVSPLDAIRAPQGGDKK